MIEGNLHRATFNQGVWIDIFPLDDINPQTMARKRVQRHRQLLQERVLLPFEAPPTTLHQFLYQSKLRLLFPSFGHARQRLNHFYSAQAQKSDFLTTNWGLLSDNSLYKSEWFRNHAYLEFEGLSMRVPAKYLDVLSLLYGKWEELPPPEKRIGTHDCIVDLSIGFEDYLRLHPID